MSRGSRTSGRATAVAAVRRLSPGAPGSDEGAPAPAVRVTVMEPLGTKILCPVSGYVFLDLSARSVAIFVPARAIGPCDPEQVFLFEVCDPDLLPHRRGDRRGFTQREAGPQWAESQGGISSV
jgi:hypothetical protein